MVCIYCRNKTKTTNSRPQRRTAGIWRRHQCSYCGAIFTSLERADYATSLGLQVGASHIVAFDRDELYISLYEACRHRPTAVQDASALTDTVIDKLLRGSETPGLITRTALINTALATLQAFDQAAYVHYAAYHPLNSPSAN